MDYFDNFAGQAAEDGANNFKYMNMPPNPSVSNQERAGSAFGNTVGNGLAGVNSYADFGMDSGAPQLRPPTMPQLGGIDPNFPVASTRLPSNYYNQSSNSMGMSDPGFPIAPSTLPQDFFNTPSMPVGQNQLGSADFDSLERQYKAAQPPQLGQQETEPEGVDIQDPQVIQQIDDTAKAVQDNMTPEDRKIASTTLSPKGTEVLANTSEMEASQMPVLGQTITDLYNTQRLYKDPGSDARTPLGQDNGDVYECPFSKQPCGRKSFFRRIIEGIKYIFGFSNQKAFTNCLSQEVKSTKAMGGGSPELNIQAFQPQMSQTNLQSLDPSLGMSPQANLPPQSFTGLSDMQAQRPSSYGQMPGNLPPLASLGGQSGQQQLTRLSDFQ